jgi:hypothetical protein
MEIGWEELQYDHTAQELLKQHEKIKFDERTKLFSYKVTSSPRFSSAPPADTLLFLMQADHQISTPAQLLATIKLHKDKAGGVGVKSLRESWLGTPQALEELIKEGDVLPMRVGKEGKFKSVFWNEVAREKGGKQVDKGQSASPPLEPRRRQAESLSVCLFRFSQSSETPGMPCECPQTSSER